MTADTPYLELSLCDQSPLTPPCLRGQPTISGDIKSLKMCPHPTEVPSSRGTLDHSSASLRVARSLFTRAVENVTPSLSKCYTNTHSFFRIEHTYTRVGTLSQCQEG